MARLSRAVITRLDDLSDYEGAAVARAIKRIGPGAGEPLRMKSPTTGQEFRVIVPDDAPRAPVVVYRQLRPSEGHGDDYLVTGLIDRRDYETYLRAGAEVLPESWLRRLDAGGP